MDFQTLRAIGGTGQPGAGAGATVGPVQIDQPGMLGRLYVGGDLNQLYECEIYDVELEQDKLTSGYVPALMFAHDACDSPLWGHSVDTTSKLYASIYNNGAAAQDVDIAWTGLSAFLVPRTDQLVPLDKGSSLRGGRSLVAVGPAAAGGTSIGGASTGTDITIAPAEKGIAGRMVVQADDNALYELFVNKYVHNNVNYLPNGITLPAVMFAHNAKNSPVFGHSFKPGDIWTIGIGNHDAGAQTAYVGLTSL